MKKMYIIIGALILIFVAGFFLYKYQKNKFSQDVSPANSDSGNANAPTSKHIENTVYKLNKGEIVKINGLSIENRGVQSVNTVESLQHLVKLFITPPNEPGKEFSTIIVQNQNKEKYLQSRVINAYGYEITITEANGFFDPITQPIEFTIINTKASSTGLKAYSLSYATLNSQADHPDFKHVLYTGSGWATFIVPLKGYSNITDDTYLITKFSWPVLPDSVPKNVTGSTYMYTTKENEFTPWPGTLDYKNSGELDAFMAWGGAQGQNVSMVIKILPENITNIENGTDFKQITQLPGFEKATYREVKNLQDK